MVIEYCSLNFIACFYNECLPREGLTCMNTDNTKYLIDT